MHILVTGGTGFIGQKLCEHFLKLGHKVTILTRKLPTDSKSLPSIPLITELSSLEVPYNVIINLAGEPLDSHRWNTSVKEYIIQSRVQLTEKIINYIKTTSIKPALLISGSAIGFYGNSQDKIFIEDSEPSDHDFIHQVCSDWEKAASKAVQYGVRVCLMRTGIVLGKNGGLLKKMLLPFKLGAGFQFGNGQQWMSWIHLQDVVRAVEYLMNHEDLKGPFNFTAPKPVTNAEFSKTLAKILHKSCFLKIPGYFIKIVFGEMGEKLLLNGQRVVPNQLVNVGFNFNFPELKVALEEIIAST